MKPETHREITRLAINICEEKGGLSSALQQPARQDEVVSGSGDEDEKNLWQRMTNWHFYRAEGSPIPKNIKAIFKTTSEDILETRIAEFISADPGTTNRFEWLGRILHHIQDMSTPSHVIPIFHGPELPFLSLRSTDDYFEKFLDDRLENIKVNSSIIDELSIDDVESFEGLYQTAAVDMLALLQKPSTGHEDSLPFAMFWKSASEEECKKIKGFGVYGDCHHYFKRKKENDDQHDPVFKALIDIQQMIAGQAILHTSRALLFATARGYI